MQIFLLSFAMTISTIVLGAPVMETTKRDESCTGDFCNNPGVPFGGPVKFSGSCFDMSLGLAADVGLWEID